MVTCSSYVINGIEVAILYEDKWNLVQDNEGVNIILKQDSRSIKKDKFSAFVYGLYYIKQQEERIRKRKKRDIGKFSFFTAH